MEPWLPGVNDMSMRVGGSHGLLSTLRRLLSAFHAGHQRWAGRRNAQLHGFIILSDRALADIGVRRADVHAAMSGIVPIEHIGRTHGHGRWMAQIHPLPRAPSAGLAANDLSAAA
jgi:uncharacterized protein YjiS (DUF1127 family)